MLDTSQFTGTEHYYRHPMTRLVYTDGVKYVADTAGAYWLIDKIAYQAKRHEFEVWKLDLLPDSSAILSCEELHHREVIDWTDFPDLHIEIWVTNGVIYLPSEH